MADNPASVESIDPIAAAGGAGYRNSWGDLVAELGERLARQAADLAMARAAIDHLRQQQAEADRKAAELDAEVLAYREAGLPGPRVEARLATDFDDGDRIVKILLLGEMPTVDLDVLVSARRLVIIPAQEPDPS